MLVKNWMSKPAITIDADASMHDAIKLLKDHNIKMLPVMEKGNLVGIVRRRRPPLRGKTSYGRTSPGARACGNGTPVRIGCLSPAAWGCLTRASTRCRS